MKITMLMEVPIGDTAGSTLLVEVERGDIAAGDLTLASPEPGKAIAKAT
jgi:hypothetical protein